MIPPVKGKLMHGGATMEQKIRPIDYPIGSLLRYVQEGIVFDPLGSYTGVVLEDGEQPVQDADDL